MRIKKKEKDWVIEDWEREMADPTFHAIFTGGRLWRLDNPKYVIDLRASTLHWHKNIEWPESSLLMALNRFFQLIGMGFIF